MLKAGKRNRVPMLVVVAAAFGVTVGLVVAFMSGPSVPSVTGRRTVAEPAASVAVSAAVFAGESSSKGSGLDEVPDSAKLFALGTLLVGLATAARRAA